MKNYLALLLFIIVSIFASLAIEASNWPQFRGPGARGIGVGDALPVTWSATENVAWKTDIPGRGWGSPVVWGDKVFLSSVINSSESEEPKKGLYFGGNRPDAPTSVHRWMAYCIDLKTGEITWEKTIHEAPPESSIHLKNSYASETPVTDGERVYFYFGNLGIFAYDFEGKLQWSKRIPASETRHGWGTAASPVLHEGRLYLVNDNDEASWLMALDAKTGKEIWKIDREPESNWSTPYVWENELRTELIVPATYRVISYDLEGKELWSFEGMSSITIGTPYAADGLLYVSSGYVGSRHKPIYAIRSGASGDISIDETLRSNDHIVWCDWRAAPYNPTTLVYDGLLYSLLDRGLLSVMNAKTGEFHLERERLGDTKSGFTASPWAYDGKVFCLNEDGETYVFKAGKSYQLLGVNRLSEDDMGMATPAMTNDKLLIRTSARLYCISEDGS